MALSSPSSQAADINAAASRIYSRFTPEETSRFKESITLTTAGRTWQNEVDNAILDAIQRRQAANQPIDVDAIIADIGARAHVSVPDEVRRDVFLEVISVLRGEANNTAAAVAGQSNTVVQQRGAA